VVAVISSASVGGGVKTGTGSKRGSTGESERPGLSSTRATYLVKLLCYKVSVRGRGGTTKFIRIEVLEETEASHIQQLCSEEQCSQPLQEFMDQLRLLPSWDLSAQFQ